MPACAVVDATLLRTLVALLAFDEAVVSVLHRRGVYLLDDVGVARILAVPGDDTLNQSMEALASIGLVYRFPSGAKVRLRNDGGTTTIEFFGARRSRSQRNQRMDSISFRCGTGTLRSQHHVYAVYSQFVKVRSVREHCGAP